MKANLVTQSTLLQCSLELRGQIDNNGQGIQRQIEIQCIPKKKTRFKRGCLYWVQRLVVQINTMILVYDYIQGKK